MDTDISKYLRQGLGRAAAFIRAEPPERYRDALLYACQHDVRYDRQCEDDRAVYLYDLIALTTEPDFYRGAVLNALASGDPEFNGYALTQMFALARRFAQDGHRESHRILYRVFARDGFSEGVSCAEELVGLDGIKGLVFTLRYLVKEEESEQLWQFERLVSKLEEREGKDVAQQAIQHAARFRPRLAKWREESRLNAEDHVRSSQPERPRLDYAGIRSLIQAGTNRFGLLWDWGKEATEEDLAHAAEDLLAESDDGRLLNYLRVFRNRRFPGPTVRLLDLVRTGEWRLAHAVKAALVHVGGADIRACALGLLDRSDRLGLAVELLAATSEPGDYRMIESLLERPLADFEYHSLGFGVLDFVKANPRHEASRSLTLLYENGPCSVCRRGCVRQLLARGLFPNWMRQECRYDAYIHTRNLVNGIEEEE